jgi:hypothetical protein
VPAFYIIVQNIVDSNQIFMGNVHFLGNVEMHIFHDCHFTQ